MRSWMRVMSLLRGRGRSGRGCRVGHTGEIDHDVPQPPAVGGGHPGGRYAVEEAWTPIEEQASGHGGSGQRPGRRRARRWCPHPGRGVRRSGPIRPWNRGSAAAMPGVSAQPGCIAANDTSSSRDPSRPLPHERDLGTLRVGVDSRAVERPSLPLQIVEMKPLGVHAAGRHGDHAGAAGPAKQGQQSGHQRERAHHHRGEGRFEPVESLGPFGEEDGPGVVDRRRRAVARISTMRLAAARTDLRDAMSATRVRKRSSAVSADSSSRRAISRSSLRPTRIRRAPRSASASVAARPRPEVGPVIRTVRPRSEPAGGGVHAKRCRRTVYPMRVKLGTTAISRASSTSLVVISVISGWPSAGRRTHLLCSPFV